MAAGEWSRIDCRHGTAWQGTVAGFLFFIMLGAAATDPSTAQESTQVVSASPATTHEPRSVLVIYSDNPLLPGNILFDETFRQALGSDSAGSVECFSEFLDEVRVPTGYEERTRDFLRAKYGQHPPDVIVAVGSPSLDFCLRYRPELFQQVPIVFAVMGTEVGRETDLGPRVTGVRSSFDGPATLRLALRLHPQTQQVFVVTGSTGIDSTSLGPGWSTFQSTDFHTTFHYLTGHPSPQLLEKLSHLPANSLVIYSSVSGSAADGSIPPAEMAERMARVSRAPIYSAFDPFLVGHGLVGAVTTPIDTFGRKTAELALEVLSSEDAARLPPPEMLPSTPLFDWRELQRWGLHKHQLPPGSIVRFEPPSFWRRHLVLVIIAGGLFLVQSGLIIALVFQSRRRRWADRETRLRREELAHMTRVATMGELTASLAHEINQPLAAILSNAQAAQRLLATREPDWEEIREILADIATDDLRAGEVIRRMRTLLRKGESYPTVLDVNDLVAEVVGLVRGEMILHDVTLDLDLCSQPLLTHGDRIQLQQVLLNLVVNSLDAMKEVSGRSRRLVIRTLAAGRSAEVSVQDSGAGVPADKLEQVFEPFVTTKPHGMGLGLSICRSIIQAHGGHLGCRNNPELGATFWFTMPIGEDLK